MSDLKSRVDRLELESLRTDVAELTKVVEDLKPGKGIWDDLKNFMPILTPFILAGFGLWATTNITSAIEKQRLELSRLNAISEFMVEIRQPGANPRDAQAAAVSLAAFGTVSLEPLIHEMNSDGDVRPLAAMIGLRALAFEHAKEVRDQLEKVLSEGNRFFTWKAHRKVIDLLGDIGDGYTIKVLVDFKTMLEADDGLAEYRKTVSDSPGPTIKNQGKIQKDLERALEKLRP